MDATRQNEAHALAGSGSHESESETPKEEHSEKRYRKRSEVLSSIVTTLFGEIGHSSI